MDIVIDLTSINNFLNQPPDVMLYQLFVTVGWIPIAIVFLWGFKQIWMNYIQDRWGAMQKSVLLAIDVPRGNAQSPRAVENMFAYLAGAHSSLDNLIELYWEGRFQRSFSFEIVSIDGYTQFLIRSPLEFRNLVETAIYSQYPDAEITEVNDYTTGMPRKFPDEEWDVFGTEFIQAKNQVYPIKTYEEFEHQFGEPETTFRDPMAALMDLCSSLRKGEQLWYQIIVKPIDMNKWLTLGDDEIKRILREDVKKKSTFAGNIVDFLLGGAHVVFNSVTTFFAQGEEKKEDKKDDSLKMMNLNPKEKKQVEAIHHKISKIGFDTKIRFVYIAKKDVMVKPKVGNGFVGYMKQFAAMDSNNIKPDVKITATSVNYFFKDTRLNARKNKIVRRYMDRDGGAGRKMGILDTEELATIWHFPIESVVKAPLIGKAPGRKAEPPSNIPVAGETISEEEFGSLFEEEVLGKPPKNGNKSMAERLPLEPAEETRQPEFMDVKTEIKGAPPENLPFA